jgi:hypothetical protein
MDERVEGMARTIDMQPEPQPVPAAGDIQTVIAQLQGMQQSQLEQANRLDALQNFIMQQAETMDSLRAIQLRQGAAQQAAAHAPVVLPPPAPEVIHPRPNVREPKVKEPMNFTGKKSQLKDHITQVRIVFMLQPSRFPDEQTKVLYAASFLRESAFSWIQPYLEQRPPPAMLSDFELYVAELKRVFGDPDEQATSERQLTNLKQTGSAASYVSEFRRVSASLGWNDRALNYIFYKGLKDHVKDELSKADRPQDTYALMELAIRIDNRFHERRLEKQSTASTAQSASHNTTTHVTPRR